MHNFNITNDTVETISNKANVVGCGKGFKYKNGVCTDQPAILVFVQKKFDNYMHKFSLDDQIPPYINGVPTDVIEVGDIMKQCQTRIRPIKPGYSISHPKVSAGTLGGYFKDADGDIVLLSNNHVLSNENNANIGDLILQPGIADGSDDNFKGWVEPYDQLAYFAMLKKFVPLSSENEQDSAIASIHPKIIEHNLIDHYYSNGQKITGFADAYVGMNIQKFGRTTCHTTGKVLAIQGTFTVGYDFGPAKFTNCIVCSPMSSSGDSGSLIFDEQMRVVGLLFAGSDKVTIATPIDTIQKHYGLKLID